MIKMTNGQCIWISNGPMSICNKFVMLSSFFPNKNKVYSSRSLPEPAHPTSFLIMAIICRSWRGCKVALLCVCTGAIALFHVPLFLATSAHPFNWVNRWLDSFCLLQSGVHLPLSLLFLPSPRLWMYVANFTMKRCSLQHCTLWKPKLQ